MCHRVYRRPALLLVCMCAECANLEVIFRKRATNYRALLRKMTNEDQASVSTDGQLFFWCVCVCMCMCVCMCVCICMNVPPCLQMASSSSGVYVCICVCVYVCMYMCMYVYVCVCVRVYRWPPLLLVCVYVYEYVCMYMCMYVYVCRMAISRHAPSLVIFRKRAL